MALSIETERRVKMWLSVNIVICMLFISVADSFDLRRASSEHYFCDEGSVRRNNSCYYFSENKESWHRARDRCREWLEGDLVSLHEDTDRSFVLDKHRNRSSWIGLHSSDGKKWQWNDGSTTVDYTSWSGGKPNAIDSERCAEMDGSGKWTSEDCNAQNHFTCRFQPRYVTIPLSSQSSLPSKVCSPSKSNCQDPGCLPRWERIGNSCYKHSEQKLNWHFARIACQQEDSRADLAAIESTEDQNKLMRNFFYEMWVGLNSHEKINEWKWSDGTPTDFLNWREDEPNLLDSEKCTEIKVKYIHNQPDTSEFNNNRCDVQKRFVCKVKKASVGNCGNGWDEFRDFCYYVPDGHASWEDARVFCKFLHPSADLASIHSEGELLYLTTKMRWFVWIGLNSLEAENKWEWSDGSPMNYTAWAEGEPNKLKEELCTQIEQKYADSGWYGAWNNNDCTWWRHFICKMPLISASATTTASPSTTTVSASPGTCSSVDVPSGVQAVCKNPKTSQILNCDERLPVGSTVEYRCKPLYTSATGLSVGRAQCAENGFWSSGRTFYCVPICGQTSVGVNRAPFIHRGRPSLRGEWPWHAALYKDDRFRCGATLISERAILTAAHCVTQQDGSRISASSLKVGLGKLYKDIDEDDASVQIMEVSAVDIPHSYNYISFESDIALLILKKPAAISIFVRPACYSMSSTSYETHLENGTLGVVAGWGDTEEGSLKGELQMTELPYVSPSTCQQFSRSPHPLRSSTYCAGFRNGTNVCSGDSGGGMTFPHGSGADRRYFLQGVVSVGVVNRETNVCQTEEYSTFTRVSSFVDSWLLDSLAKYEYR